MTLLFKKKYIEKIQRGEKTSTRRAKRPKVSPTASTASGSTSTATCSTGSG